MIIISSLTLWFLETYIKYYLLILEFTIIIIFYFITKNINISISLNYSFKIMRLVDFLFVFLSFSLFLLSLIKINNIFTLIFALSISYFGLGHFLLRLVNFYSYKTNLEWITLSFWLSIPINCLIYSLVLNIPTEQKTSIITTLYIIFISLSTIISQKREHKSVVKDGHFNIELKNILPLSIITIFFIISIAANYPDMAYRPGLDIVRHLSISRLLNSNPQSFRSYYPWIYFQWASLQLFYMGSRGDIQTMLAFLSIISVISFYILAKAYLEDLDNRLPALSTVFWGLFSGFGWLHFLSLKLTSVENDDYLKLLNIANKASYKDVGSGQGPWVWLWFRPMTLGVTGVFILLYLLRRKDLNPRVLFPLFSISILSLGFVHFSELVFFVGILFVLSIMPYDGKVELKNSSFAVLLGLLSLIGFTMLYRYLGIEFDIPNLIIGLVLLAAILAFLSVRFKKYIPRLRFPTVNINKFIRYFVMGLLVIWLSTLFYWLINAKNFKISLVIKIWGVPWLFYPTLLGICGLFSFPGIYYILKKYSECPLVIFIVMLVYSIFFGRMLTMINANYIKLGYSERRIISLTFSASAILSSLPLLRFLERLNSRPFFKSFFLSLIVLGGFTSTALSIENQILHTEQKILNENELKDIQKLDLTDPNSYLLTYSERSFIVSEFTPFSWRIDHFRDQIWPAKSAELALNIISSKGYPGVIYLREDDLTQLSRPKYSEGYMIQHLVNVAPESYNSTVAYIYNLPKLIPPSEASDTVLVLPEGEFDPIYFYAFDALSLAGYNYTTASISDLQTLSNSDIVVVTSEKLAGMVLKVNEVLGLCMEHLIILNFDGEYGELADMFSPPINVFLNSSKYGKVLLSSPLDTALNTTSNIQGVLSTPFNVETVPGNNSLIFSDDDAKNSWRRFARYEGNLRAPRLSDSPDLKASGENSLTIKVGNGEHGQWGISHVINEKERLDEYDFLTFYWYGKGDETKYVVQAICTNLNRSFWYSFTDGWVGWRKVMLPMNVNDGAYTIEGVKIVKVTRGDPNWNEVNRIEFKLSKSNLNVSGTFHLDRFAFEKCIQANLTVNILGDLQELELLSQLGGSYTSISILRESEIVPLQDYYLSNGLSAVSILGNDIGHLTLEKLDSQRFKAQISFKMPPVPWNSSLSKTTFSIKPLFKQEIVSSIISEQYSLDLPIEVKSVHIISRANTLAKFDTGTFFAINFSFDGTNIDYLNFYPIINALENGARILYPLLGNITKMGIRDHPIHEQFKKELNGGRVVAFKNAELDGNITISFDSIIIHNTEDAENEALVDGVSIPVAQNAVFISASGFHEAALNTNSAKIIPGKGYYLKIVMNKTKISLGGPSTSLVTYHEDGSFTELKGNNITVNLKSGELSLRKPIIKVEGRGWFERFYAYYELRNRISSIGDDCEIKGIFTFVGLYGDTFSIAKDFNYRGVLKLSKKLYDFDEVKSFINSIPYFFLTLTVIIIFYLYICKRNWSII